VATLTSRHLIVAIFFGHEAFFHLPSRLNRRGGSLMESFLDYADYLRISPVALEPKWATEEYNAQHGRLRRN
jgi:hypothetical protein